MRVCACARTGWAHCRPGGASSHPCLSWLRVLIVFRVPGTLFLEVAAEQGLEPGAVLFTGLLQAGPTAGEGHTVKGLEGAAQAGQGLPLSGLYVAV